MRHGLYGYIVTAFVVIAYVVMVYTVMAGTKHGESNPQRPATTSRVCLHINQKSSYGLNRYGLNSYGLHSYGPSTSGLCSYGPSVMDIRHRLAAWLCCSCRPTVPSGRHVLLGPIRRPRRRPVSDLEARVGRAYTCSPHN